MVADGPAAGAGGSPGQERPATTASQRRCGKAPHRMRWSAKPPMSWSTRRACAVRPPPHGPCFPAADDRPRGGPPGGRAHPSDMLVGHEIAAGHIHRHPPHSRFLRAGAGALPWCTLPRRVDTELRCRDAYHAHAPRKWASHLSEQRVGDLEVIVASADRQISCSAGAASAGAVAHGWPAGARAPAQPC